MSKRLTRTSHAAAVVALLFAACSRSALTLSDALNPCLTLLPNSLSTHEVKAKINLDRTDIFFLIDNSVSMGDEIDEIRRRLLDDLVPRIRQEVSDPTIGVGVFADFSGEMENLSSHPYQMLQPLTDDVDEVASAMKGITLEFGGDEEESHLEALFQAATGDGLGVYVPKQEACEPGTQGGACFRDGAFRVIMLFTDARMRSVKGLLPDGSTAPESGDDPAGVNKPFLPNIRTYDETIDALRKKNVRVLGLWSGTNGGIDDLQRVARDTGALDEDGKPIVFDIGREGTALGDGVLGTLRSVASGLRRTVDLTIEDGDPEDGLDARALVKAVRAVSSAPVDGATPQGERFTNARAGTLLNFEVVLDTSIVPSTAFDQRFPLKLSVVSSDGTRVWQEMLDVVVAATTECGRRP
jgi:hypothetical protein